MIKKLPHKGINQPSSTPTRPMKEPDRKERAMLTDTEKAALVEELQAILHGCVIIANFDDDAAPTTLSDGTINTMAYSLLPAIERLFAERSIDALLDAPNFEDEVSQAVSRAEYEWVPQPYGNYNVSRMMYCKHIGKAVVEHLRSAVKAAKEVEA